MITKQRQSILDQDPTVTGFNVGINVGASAGQTVFHVHVHLIPRRDYVVLVPRSGGAYHNSVDIGLSNAAPCYTAAVWDRSLSTFNSASSSQYVLTISDFEP